VFSIAVDRTHTVLLVAFTDRLQVQDIADLDRLVRPIAATGALKNVVVDMRQVTEIEVPFEQWAVRASAAPVLPGRKLVFVAAAGSVLNFCREYAAYRDREGHDAIPVVPDLEAAWRILAIDAPTFGYD
jgi:hypothetical protein